MNTTEVLDHHLQAFGEGLDSLMMDYDDKSCLMSPDGTYKGTDKIRDFFSAFVGGLPEGFLESFKLNRTEVVGEVAYITWESLPSFPLGTDTFVVRDGKILYQTFAAYTSA